MSINIEALAAEASAASWLETYGFPRPPLHENENRRERTLARVVALKVLEQCIREIGSVSVQAPDAQIVKDKVSGRLRKIAAEIRTTSNAGNGETQGVNYARK
jgi:hypothetical protein